MAFFVYLRSDLKSDNPMKKLLTILLTLFLFSSAYAEVRVVDKLEYRDGFAYAVGESEGFSGQLATTTLDEEIKTSYKDGKKLNKTRYVLKSGFLVKDLKITYNDYDQEIIKINYEGGKEFGRTINEYYKNKQLKITKLYKPNNYLSKIYEPPNGYLLTQTSFYKNGNVESSLNFDSSTARVKVIQKYFYANGQLEHEEIYLKGKNTGCDTKWNKSGQIIEINKCNFYNMHSKWSSGPYTVQRASSYIEKFILSYPYIFMWLLSIILLSYALLRKSKTSTAWILSLLFFTLLCTFPLIQERSHVGGADGVFTILAIYSALMIYYSLALRNSEEALQSAWYVFVVLMVIPSLITFILFIMYIFII
jgi:antitoxin component YwqK of YwqJK toxin-antitoxin module